MCKKFISSLMGGEQSMPARQEEQAREDAAEVKIENGASSVDENGGRVRLGKSARKQQDVAGLSI